MSTYIKFRDDIPENAPIWAHRINELLRDTNMTQGELAKEIGFTPSTLTGWLKGDKEKFTMPKVDGLVKVAEYFGVSMDYLVGLSDCKKIDSEYKVGEKYFGMREGAMDRLRGLLDKQSLKPSADDSPAIKRSREITSLLINFILENQDFWSNFEQLTEDYISLIYDQKDKEIKKISVHGVTVSDVVRYRIGKVFDKLSDDIFNRLFPQNKPSELFASLIESKNSKQKSDKK